MIAMHETTPMSLAPVRAGTRDAPDLKALSDATARVGAKVLRESALLDALFAPTEN